MGSRKWNLCDI